MKLLNKFLKLYEGNDLLTLEASALNKYVTAVMDILFTHEELINGIVQIKKSLKIHLITFQKGNNLIFQKLEF